MDHADPYTCPDCSAPLDSPSALCVACGYELHPTPADDQALDAWEAKIAADAAAYAGGA
jgi:hypothetical protein